MNELTTFNYEGKKVRTIQRNGETWWVAKYVCDVFGEANRNRAMQYLDEDEKGYTQMTTPGGVLFSFLPIGCISTSLIHSALCLIVLAK
ncbi:hypothetical protein OXPF_23930 [Oxobacter pfennigii]|uniref:Bro-N domain-containing protein n=1 Tax=Oxobacter pfennigii TaxID=36849 RepID=A0A0P8YWW7_9CLOT|nr:BRO family protein [Oxobacter pfennigii]KPU44225.1 hypothetical protein OXPF_23930 [Oxobacter pfennigii]